MRRRRQNGETMMDERLSAADRALRDTNYPALGAHPVRRTPRAAATRRAGLTPASYSVAVVPGRGLPAEMGRLRRLTTVRPVHHLLPGDRWRNVPLVVAGLRGLPGHQRSHRIPLGFSAVRAGQAQPDEWNRRPRGCSTRGAAKHRSNVSWRSSRTAAACAGGAVANIPCWQASSIL